jgi:hypothetical protein
MSTEAPNYQWTEGGDFFDGDRGTLALGVGPPPPPLPDPDPPITEDFEDGSFNVSISGDWALATDQFHAGTQSLKSAEIDDSESSDAVVTIPTGYTHVKFWYRVSSEECCDFFQFLLDTDVALSVGGETGWVESPLIALGPAASLTFRYVKDGSATEGDDAAWIDDLEFTQVLGVDPDGLYRALHTDEDGNLFIEHANATAVNVPSQTVIDDTAETILSLNTVRRGWMVQNTGTTVIKLALGSTDPTQTAYHISLNACATADDGTGGVYTDDQWVGDVRAISSAPGGTIVILDVS